MTVAEFRRTKSFKGLGVGCKLGLEHFGRQFSEIGRLHDLGLDYLKVDGSFVRGLDGTVTRDVTAESFLDSSNAEVATVDKAGLVSTVRRGEATMLEAGR